VTLLHQPIVKKPFLKKSDKILKCKWDIFQLKRKKNKCQLMSIHCFAVSLLAVCPFSFMFHLFIYSENEEDFRRTACTSLLQHVVETSSRRREESKGEEQITKNSGSEGISPQSKLN